VVSIALSLDLFLLKRFFSPSLFLLLDEPQPRKTNGEDHHHDQNGVLNHRSDPELMLTDQRRPKEKVAPRITSFQRLDPPVGGVTLEYLCR
jgi:hypothetical protein